MCLAEALLRVPDTETMDDLIADKIAPHDWSAHSGGSSSIFVNASTWALMLTGRVLDEGEGGIDRHAARHGAPARRAGDPHGGGGCDARNGRAVRARPHHRRSHQARPLDDRRRAISIPTTCWARPPAPRPTRCAIIAPMPTRFPRSTTAPTAPTSATTPAFRSSCRRCIRATKLPSKEAMLPVMAERLLSLALAAKRARMGLNIDAEEADRLDLSLDVIERVLADPRACRLERFRRRRAGLWPARGLRHRLALRACRTSSTATSWCGWSRAPTGTPRSSAPRCSGCRLPGLHPQGQHRRLLHRLRAQAACR